MMNDTIEVLLVLEMEPKPESMWWISMCEDEEMKILRVGGQRQNWGFPRYHHDNQM